MKVIKNSELRNIPAKASVKPANLAQEGIVFCRLNPRVVNDPPL
jgi:hypothetical protein